MMRSTVPAVAKIVVVSLQASVVAGAKMTARSSVVAGFAAGLS
jgi:hypothetical protein